MSARAALHAVLLALVLLASACMKDEMASATIDELNALTDDIVKVINEAEDKQAGVAKAQELIDAKKGELGPKMQEVLELRGFQISEETTTKIASGLVENTLKMATLEIDLTMAMVRDPELEAAVDKLTSDHQALINGK